MEMLRGCMNEFKTHAGSVDLTSALCASSRMSSPLWNCCSLTWLTQRCCCRAPSQELLFAKPGGCKLPMDENMDMLRGCRHGTQSNCSDMSLSAKKFYGARQVDGALQCNLRLSRLSEQGQRMETRTRNRHSPSISWTGASRNICAAMW